MITYEWTIKEVYSANDKLTEVKFGLTATDDANTVETEGYHSFSDGVVYKPFSEIKEEDLIRWLEKDTTQNDVNIIKLNLENQLDSLKSVKKSEFPWLVDTFTIG